MIAGDAVIAIPRGVLRARGHETFRHGEETILPPREGNLKQAPGKQRRAFNNSII
jgi:hypothetical protein